MLQKNALEIVVLFILLAFGGIALAHAEDKANVQNTKPKTYLGTEHAEEPNEYGNAANQNEETSVGDSDTNTQGGLYENEAHFESEADQRGPASTEDQGARDLVGPENEDDRGDPDIYEGEQTEPEARPEAFEYREYREQGENLD